MKKQSKINVGIVILSNTWGGAEESVFKIARYVSKTKINVYLLVNDFLFEKYKTIPNVKAIDLGKLESNKRFEKVKTLFNLNAKVKKEIANNKINVIHTQLENTLMMFLAGGVPNVRQIFTLRGEETSIYLNPTTFEQYLIKFSMKKLFSDKSVTVTAVSEWLKNRLPDNEKSKIKVCVNGVDTQVFKPPKKPRDNNTILYVGRYTAGKGIEELVKAAQTLKNYNFLFVGKGPLKEKLKLVNTIDLGFKSRSEIAKLFQKTTISAFPTTFAEGMPNVGLESLASGTPAVASKIGYSEIIENGKEGIIIEPGKMNELKLAIRKLIKNPALRKVMEKNARKKALKYDIRKTVKNYEVLYLENASS